MSKDELTAESRLRFLIDIVKSNIHYQGDLYPGLIRFMSGYATLLSSFSGFTWVTCNTSHTYSLLYKSHPKSPFKMMCLRNFLLFLIVLPFSAASPLFMFTFITTMWLKLRPCLYCTAVVSSVENILLQ